MNRREAIKNLAMVSLATMVLSGCNFSGDDDVSNFFVNGKFLPDAEHKQYLSGISETFLPLANRPVALEEQGSFILKMVNDCRSPEEREKFVSGFQKYKDAIEKSRLSMNSSEPEEVLTVVRAALGDEGTDEDLLYFIGTMKELSLYNLKNSEFYMTEYLDYNLFPPTYGPCVVIQKA